MVAVFYFCNGNSSFCLFREFRSFEETCPFVSLTLLATEFLVALNVCVIDQIQVVEKQELETPQKQVIITMLMSLFKA